MIQALAWPAVALILGLVAIFVFRGPLSRFLDRAKKIGKTGIEAAGPEQETRSEIKPSPADEFMRLFDNELLVQREQWIRGQLETRLGGDQTERERVLIRVIAASSIVQQFETAYRFIWGSQLGVLEFLNTVGASGLPKDVLTTFYNQAAAREPSWYAEYTFDQWLGFLQSSQLITMRNDQVLITIEGREFLKFVLHQGYSLYKQG